MCISNAQVHYIIRPSYKNRVFDSIFIKQLRNNYVASMKWFVSINWANIIRAVTITFFHWLAPMKHKHVDTDKIMKQMIKFNIITKYLYPVGATKVIIDFNSRLRSKFKLKKI